MKFVIPVRVDCSFTMLFSMSFLSLLGLTSLVAASPEDIFKRANAKKPVIEKRVPHEGFKNERLEKRASRFMTPQTEKFVVNGLVLSCRWTFEPC